VRHLVLNYPDDKNVYDIEDEFMLGDAIRAAPIITEGTTERTVYLPCGSWQNLLTGETVTGGTAMRIHASIAQIPVFLNLDSEDAKSLLPIFASDAWKIVMNKK
jgi:alpha-D-xyloside xylohydrolase